jgi:hypothetical protein
MKVRVRSLRLRRFHESFCAWAVWSFALEIGSFHPKNRFFGVDAMPPVLHSHLKPDRTSVVE